MIHPKSRDSSQDAKFNVNVNLELLKPSKRSMSEKNLSNLIDAMDIPQDKDLKETQEKKPEKEEKEEKEAEKNTLKLKYRKSKLNDILESDSSAYVQVAVQELDTKQSETTKVSKELPPLHNPITK